MLALCLKQVPLRDTAAVGSADLGEGSRCLRRIPRTHCSRPLSGGSCAKALVFSCRRLPVLRAVASTPASLWALLQIYRHGQVMDTATLSGIAVQHRVPRELIEPIIDRLVSGGFARRHGDDLWLTPAGSTEVNFCRNFVAQWILKTLARSPEFESRPDVLQVQGALERLARKVLVQNEWLEESDPLTQSGQLREVVDLDTEPHTHSGSPAPSADGGTEDNSM